MTTYPLDKPSYFLPASEVSYASERYEMNTNKMANFSLAKMHILLPFYLILTRGPIIIVKRVVLS